VPANIQKCLNTHREHAIQTFLSVCVRNLFCLEYNDYSVVLTDFDVGLVKVVGRDLADRWEITSFIDTYIRVLCGLPA
jgi:hypothetical protein